MAEHLVGVEIPISAGISPDSFGHATDADLLFRLLIVEDLSTETSGFKPGELLYETTTLRSNFVELRQGVTQIFNVSIPSVDVEPGRSYAFVLDAVADMPADGFGWRSVPATMDSFDQGEFYSLRIDRDAQHAPIGSRTDHFQDEWLRFDHSAIDMQFRLEFVPEPSAFKLFGLALAFFCLVRRRIRQ